MGLGGESGSEPEAGEPLLYHTRIVFVKTNFKKNKKNKGQPPPIHHNKNKNHLLHNHKQKDIRHLQGDVHNADNNDDVPQSLLKGRFLLLQ